jgi:hypothetical protein
MTDDSLDSSLSAGIPDAIVLLPRNPGVFPDDFPPNGHLRRAPTAGQRKLLPLDGVELTFWRDISVQSEEQMERHA